MHKVNRALAFIPLALSLTPLLSGQQSPPPACPTDAVCVLYTSKLLGYIRTDDRVYTQPFFEKNMQDAKTKSWYPSALVVAMGDNLAPEYEARFEPDKNDPAKLVPKARTGFSLRKNELGEDVLPDNVLDEMVKFYDVIAPGKEEFYFGAERLRVLARTTKQLNAANVAETPVYKLPEPEPNDPKPRSYLDSHPHFKPFDDGHLVLGRTDDRKPAYSIEIQKDEIEIHTDAIDYASPQLQVCDADHPGVNDCSPAPLLDGQIMGDGSPGFKVVTYDLSTLKGEPRSGSRRLMCFTKSKKVESGDPLLQHERFCHLVVIDENLFKEFPYYVATKRDKKFAVFVVVGADVKQLVSKTNLQWAGAKDNEVKAEVAIWNPASAVRQAYYECRLRKHCSSEREPVKTTVVVLAQMSRAAARTLADDIFDVKPEVIISKAEAEGSPYGDNLDYFSAGQKVPVIATHSIFTQDDSCSVLGSPKGGQTLRNPLHLVAAYTVNSEQGVEKRLNHVKTPAGSEWCVDRNLTLSPSEAKEQAETRTEALQRGEPVPPQVPQRRFSLDVMVAGSKWNSEDLEHFVAEQMRRIYLGDVGVVSKHEIFRERETGGPMSLGEKTERAVWEGAHITRVRLSGKSLRQAMDAQKDAPPDHQLVYSGIVPNDSKNYYVNGRPLLDDSYYTVIAPDALVWGDPSYAAFFDNAFQEPDVRPDSVAGFICNILGSPSDRNTCTLAGLERGEETLSVKSPPPFFHPDSYLLSVIAPRYHDPISNPQGKCDDAGKLCPQQKQVELRPLWFAKLLRNDMSYSLEKPNTSDVNLGQKFAGVTDPRVVKAHSEKYNVDHDLRLGRNWSFFSVGAEEMIQFGRTREGSTRVGKGDNVTLTANTGTVGPFFEFAFAHNAAPNWRLIVRPTDFSDNFARTPTSLSGTGTTTFNLSLPAQRTLATKVGFRYEAPQRKESLFSKDGNSFFEAGYQTTLSINLPAAIALNPGPTQTLCSLASATFAQCAASVTAVDSNATITSFENNRQQGLYWTGMFSFPIGKRFTYKAASIGDLRFGDVLSAQTLYAVSIDNYLQTRIWGNFSLAPHMGWFLYENQVEHNTLTRRTYDVSLSYVFDWHRGMGWRPFFMQPETAKQ